MTAFDALGISYRYMRHGGLIPSETKTGQLSFLPHGFGAAPRPVRPVTSIADIIPPFKGGSIFPRGNGPASYAVLRSHVMQAARRQEKAQKAAVAKARAKRSKDKISGGRKLSPEAADMVGGDYGRMGHDEANFIRRSRGM